MQQQLTIAERVAEIRRKIEAAARTAGRDPSDIQLIAASKTVNPERIRDAQAAGIEICGENRVQEAIGKVDQVPGMRWHLIGHLQRNKARRAVELFELIHSLDSIRLAQALQRLADERDRAVDVLIQVNLAGEATKRGIAPESAAEFVRSLADFPQVRVHGLMAIPPLTTDDERARAPVRRLARLARDLRDAAPQNVKLDQLSIGMSGDFQVAIEEGATMVRIGSGIFGPRAG